ncbi:lipase family protein [Nocardia sp. NPDC052001]|uniref:lipase family protein n=1 Tax=Nocardia sp. NPDC052001 TaxID=3154853 RepID=UPI003420A43A
MTTHHITDARPRHHVSALLRLSALTGALALTGACVLAGLPAASADDAPDPVAAQSAPADTFYDPPAGYESTTPGTILASRAVRAAALPSLPLAVNAWQLLYRTTDADGNPYAAVTTVLRPETRSGPTRLLSVQAAYDSIQRTCMPSYTMTAGDLASPPPSEALEAAIALDRGWTVSIPDPGGIDNRFLTPRVMGYTVLDGIRAAENFSPLGLDGAATRTALTGYSGGGIGTSWAAELHPSYAPELNIVGAVLGAPIPDLAAAMRSVSGRISGGLIAVGVAAVMYDSPEFSAALDRYLKPGARAILAAAGRECVSATVSKNLFINASDLLTVPLDQVLSDPVIHATIADRARGTATPTTPMYIVNAVNDEVSPIAKVDALVARYCAAGASVSYVRDDLPDLISDHSIEALTSVGGSFTWLDRAMNSDTPNPPTCQTTTVPSTFTDGSWSTQLPAFTQSLARVLLSQSLGQ